MEKIRFEKVNPIPVPVKQEVPPMKYSSETVQRAVTMALQNPELVGALKRLSD